MANGNSLAIPPDQPFLITVIIFDRNGEKLLHACLNLLHRLEFNDFQTVELPRDGGRFSLTPQRPSSP
jgi:hypothetical protein